MTRRGRFSIAAMLGVIVFCAMILAGLRSGSNDAFKGIYTLTFLALVYASIAARYRGAFWPGFAIAGWAYFLVGFGPWIGTPPGSEPLRALNRNLVSSVILEMTTGSFNANDPVVTIPNLSVHLNRWANRDGIGHSALTILFACAGGLVSRRMAGQAPA